MSMGRSHDMNPISGTHSQRERSPRGSYLGLLEPSGFECLLLADARSSMATLSSSIATCVGYANSDVGCELGFRGSVAWYGWRLGLRVCLHGRRTGQPASSRELA